MSEWHSSQAWVKARAQAKKVLPPVCSLCNKDLEGSDWTIDHVLPPSQTGGTPDHSLNNLQSLCRACNGRKQDNTLTRQYWVNTKWVS